MPVIKGVPSGTPDVQTPVEYSGNISLPSNIRNNCFLYIDLPVYCSVFMHFPG